MPSTDKTTFTITTKVPTSFSIRIRKPHWAQNVQVSINGTLKKVLADKEGYIVLNKKWVNNDKIEFISPLHFYTELMPDNVNRKAVFYGPVLLAGVLGDKEPDPLDVPVFVTGETDAGKWIQPVPNQTLVFQTSSTVTAKPVQLIPFNTTANEHYTVYWDVFTPQQWTVQKKIYEAEKMKQQELEARTVDNIRIGEMQPERDHELVGEKTTTGDEHNRKWRMAADSGYFSFTMKVDPSANNTLVCTYWGMDNRGRIFDIYINDIKIATEDLNKYKSSKFYEITYPISLDLTKYKLTAKIKFVPKAQNSAGPLYDAKIVKGDVSGLIKSN